MDEEALRMNNLFLKSLNEPALLTRVFEQVRSRQSWNERLEHWEKPASVSEEGTITRAEKMVRDALSANNWLVSEGICLLPQGSYHNNTNVRQDADIDLRLVHPLIRVIDLVETSQSRIFNSFSYYDSGRTYADILQQMRAETVLSLGRHFGSLNVDDSGNKAIRVKGITGSRAEVDVVPTFNTHLVVWSGQLQQFITLKGVAILGKNLQWTENFPDQHTANGVAKRERTAHRFKKMVRIFKRLRNDMVDQGIVNAKVPSFLVECLVYAVEDEYFLNKNDDRYDRTRRLAQRMRELLASPTWVSSVTEINGIKLLFGPGQAWTAATAQSFISAVNTHLGNV